MFIILLSDDLFKRMVFQNRFNFCTKINLMILINFNIINNSNTSITLTELLSFDFFVNSIISFKKKINNKISPT